MEILGVGPLELLLIVLIMLIVLGPKEMVVTARKIGQGIRKLIRSPMWRTIMDTTREVRDIPGKIIQEAGLEQDIAQIKEIAKTPGQIINEAAKELTVDIEPIKLPQVPSVSSILSPGLPVPQPTQNTSPTTSENTTIEVKPLEVDNISYSSREPIKRSASPQGETAHELTSENVTPLEVETIIPPAVPIVRSEESDKKRRALRARIKKPPIEVEQIPNPSGIDNEKDSIIQQVENGSGLDG